MTAKRVLVIDDDENIRELMKEYLGMLEIEALTADGGKEGLEKARAEKPDAVLLDVMMPDMSGSDVAETLKQDPETRDIPVIFLTGLASKNDTEMSPRGGHNFLSKELAGEEFIAKLTKFLP
jgi:CheY-like chemotaxis protein